MRAALVINTDLLQQRFIPKPALRIVRYVRSLEAKKAQIHLVEWIRWPTDLPEGETKNGIHYRRFLERPPPSGMVGRARFVWGLNRRVRDELVRIRPDGILVQDAELLWGVSRAARKLRVPLFYDSHEHFPGMVALERPFEAKLYEFLERRVAPRITHVYPSSSYVADRFRAMECEATVLCNSPYLADLEASRLPRGEAKKRLGFSDDSFVLGFTGPIDRNSGLEPALAALSNLPSDVRLMIVGGPEGELARMRALAESLGVARRVRIEGPVGGEEAIRIACAFDLGLLTLAGSGPNYEWRSPGKMFEYMGLGIPALYTDYPEMRRVVEGVGFGIAIPPPPSADAICAAVLEARMDQARLSRMERNARAAFEREYSGERQRERLTQSHPFWR